MGVLLLLFVFLAVGQSASVNILIGQQNSVSFSPTSVTINPGDTVNFVFFRPGDAVISAADNSLVCPNGVNPVVGSCNVAANPAINITGPLSAQPPFSVPVVFPSLGIYSVVNPTYCQTSPAFATVACSAKANISVVVPTPTPAPGSTIIAIGYQGQGVAFPTPLVVTTGGTVWFRFDQLASVTQVDANGIPVSGGLTCPQATQVGQYCSWVLTQQQTYYFTTNLGFGGRIDAQPNPTIPPGAFVIDVGLNGTNTFSVPTNQPIPVNSIVYFRFNSYGPFRVLRGDSSSCQPFIGVGSFDSLYQASGRVFPAGIVTAGVTYFYDTTFCPAPTNMKSSVLASGGSNGSQFVEVMVAPRSNSTGASQLIFSPTPAIVYQGGFVRWIFNDFGHTVTQSLNNDNTTCLAQPGGFDSGFVQPPTNGIGGAYTLQFNTLGTFYYHCSAHCELGMRGAVIVVPNPQNTITHGVNDTVNPNQFSPPVLVTSGGETVCWFFITAGNIVQSQYYQQCVPLPGGFNSGPQPAGATVCVNMTGASCTAFYYYDSTFCATGMFGVVLISDPPTVTVNNNATIYNPQNLSVTVGSTVTWSFTAAGSSVTQAQNVSQFSSTDQSVRCATQPGGFDSGVITVAGATYSNRFNNVGLFGYLSTPFCPFPSTFPNFYGFVRVCNPIQTAPTTAPPTTAAPPTEPPTPCPTPNPCTSNIKKTVINFYFADILAGAQCSNCTA